MVEESQLETAVSARTSGIDPVRPQWRKGRKQHSRVPLFRSEYVLVFLATRTRSNGNVLICGNVTRTRSLPIYNEELSIPSESRIEKPSSITDRV